MDKPTEVEVAKPDVLIEQAYRILVIKALQGRALAPDWETMRRRPVSAMAVFRTDAEAPKAIAQAYAQLIQEANRVGLIVTAHRPFFSGGEYGCTLELGVDAALPPAHYVFVHP